MLRRVGWFSLSFSGVSASLVSSGRLYDLLEVVGHPRRLEVAGDVVPLLAQLVRVDDERLVHGRDDTAEHDQGDDPDGDGERPPLVPPPHVPDEHGGENEGDHHGHTRHGQPDHDVRVRGSVDGAGRGVQQVPGLEQLADADDDEDRREQRGEMRDRPAAELDVDLRDLRRRLLGAGERRRARLGVRRRLARLLLELDAAHDEMDDGGEHQRGDESGQDEVEDALPHRRGEHVERDVSAEDRVLLAERGLVEVQEEALPGAGGGDPGDEGDDHADGGGADAHPLAHGGAARLEERPVHVGAEVRRQPPRQLDVGPHDDEEHRERGGAQEEPRPDARPEHLEEPDLAEPQPVDVQTEQAAAEGEHEHDDGDDDRSDDASSRGPVAAFGRGFLLGTERADVVHA